MDRHTNPSLTYYPVAHMYEGMLNDGLFDFDEDHHHMPDTYSCFDHMADLMEDLGLDLDFILSTLLGSPWQMPNYDFA